MKNVVIFTVSFPSSFLENEIPYLLEKFELLHIITPNDEGNYYLPQNVRVHVLKSNYKQSDTPKYIFKHFFKVARIYLYSMFLGNNLFYYLRYYRSFLGYLLKELELIKPIKDLIQKFDLRDALFYDYWLVDATIALAELRREGFIKRSVARVHGFDLYDERQFEGRVSFRDYRIKHLDAVFTISKDGDAYLRNRVPEAQRKKICLSYLGVPRPERIPPDKPQINGKYTIVSCARLVTSKRIDTIAEVLRNIGDLEIKWLHFGDGPERSVLQEKTKELPSNITFEFIGHVTNSELRKFYSENYIDMFLSVSIFEGLPVSMMEAISFGIPIFAVDVNGVSELVTSETGVLVPPTSHPLLMSQQLRDVLVTRFFDRNKIVSFFEGNFDAGKNYRVFVERLSMQYNR